MMKKQKEEQSPIPESTSCQIIFYFIFLFRRLLEIVKKRSEFLKPRKISFWTILGQVAIKKLKISKNIKITP